MHLKVCKSRPNDILFKYNYREESYKSVAMQRKHHNIIAANMPKLYSTCCGISKSKKMDLLKLCEKHLILAQHHGFYEALTTEEENDD